MNHRRLIFPAFLLLAAALVVAVQRDTFVRRWLLPPPPPRMAVEAKLKQILPEVRIENATLDEAAAELSRLAGVAITVDPLFYEACPGSEDRRTDLRLSHVTLAEALTALDEALLKQFAGGWTRGPTAVATDTGITITSDIAAHANASVRLYDVADLLPPPPLDPAAESEPAFVSALFPKSARQSEMAYLVQMMLHRDPAVDAWTQGAVAVNECVVHEMDGNLIVVAPESAQERVARLLEALRRAKQPTQGQ